MSRMKKQRDNPLPLLKVKKQDNPETTPLNKNKTTLYPCYKNKNDTTPKKQNDTGTKNEKTGTGKRKEPKVLEILGFKR